MIVDTVTSAPPLSSADLVPIPARNLSRLDPHAATNFADLESIGDALAVLDRAAETGDPDVYSLFWLNRLYASGGYANVRYSLGRPAQIWLGAVSDLSEDERLARMSALAAHFKAHPWRRQAVVAFLRAEGLFEDARPYATAEQAIEQAQASGIGLLVTADGKVLIVNNVQPSVDRQNAWAAKCAVDRVGVSLRQPGWRERIVQLLRKERVDERTST